MPKIRSETDDDCRLLWQWANDADVRNSSFGSTPIPWEEHVAWFRRKRGDPNCHMYVLSDRNGHPFGQVRFDIRDDGSAEVHISIERDQRGRGLGAEALRLACTRFFTAADVQQIVAHIKPENVPSIRAFEKAGFVHQGMKRVKGHKAVHMSMWREQS